MYIICILLCKMIHSAQGMTEGNNLHLMSSTFQLEELLRKEVQLVQELNEYLSLLREESKKVQNYLDKNYQLEEFFADKNKGKNSSDLENVCYKKSSMTTYKSFFMPIKHMKEYLIFLQTGVVFLPFHVRASNSSHYSNFKYFFLKLCTETTFMKIRVDL